MRRHFLHFSVHPAYWCVLLGLFATALFALHHASGLGDFLGVDERTNGKKTLKVFAAVTQPAESTVVRILSGERMVALGTVVSPLGYVVTKDSELPDKPIAELSSGERFPVNVLARDRELDLALMIIPGARLKPVRWGRSEGLKIGDWLVAPGQEDRSWVGVMSAKRRDIKRVGGALGVSLGDPRRRMEGVVVWAVVDGSPADKAGILPGDQILRVGTKVVRSSEETVAAIQDYDPGDKVTLELNRDEGRMLIKVELGFYSIFDFRDRNQAMSGETSDRRNGFPNVIQHAVPLTPDAMGGPLVNLRGETVGINIARADRVTTYALPSERVTEAVRNMVEGLRNPVGVSSREVRSGSSRPASGL